jgi:hypothetical protein
MRIALALLSLLLPLPAVAAPPAASLLCRSAIASAEYTEHLPPHLLDAIARVESGRPDPETGLLHPWPWTINAAGEGLFYDSKAQAIAAVKTFRARGVTSIDVGCMQVNLLIHPDAFANLDQAFDPPTNASWAARFLNRLKAAAANWTVATGRYHSPTPEIASDYQRRVMVEWKRPFGLPVPVQYGAFQARGQSFRAIMPAAEHFRAIPPPEQMFAAFAKSGAAWGSGQGQ